MLSANSEACQESTRPSIKVSRVSIRRGNPAFGDATGYVLVHITCDSWLGHYPCDSVVVPRLV